MQKFLVTILAMILACLSLAGVSAQGAGEPNQQLYPLRKPTGNQWALSDRNGKIHARFTLPKYGTIQEFKDGLGLVRNTSIEKWGVIDHTGKLIVPYKYNYISSFSEGLASFQIGERSGVIDRTGKEVIPPKYERIVGFRFGRSAASVNKKWGLIDTKGNWIVQPTFDYVGYIPERQQYSNDPILIKQGPYYGYMDAKGTVLVPPKYVLAKEFSDGLAAVQEKDKQIGFINSKGEYIIAPIYYFTVPFRNGIAYASSWKADGKSLGGGLINKKGEWIIPPGEFTPFAGSSDVEEGIYRYYTNKEDGQSYAGAVTLTGEVILEPKYSAIGRFYNGIAMVRLHDGREGFINRKGEYLVSPRYFGTYQSPYGSLMDRNGLYAINWGLDGYLDYTGKLVIPPYQ
ncbi:WG repeat-containing protein [Brevibacillus agri]|uniref:WG repeat-containing protein n=1 Tax=Brevibacillus agri TaxID=51101 RepID=UPI001C8E0DE6|nr:WG repeat-containing protein [Brevibacillus agri]MBY0054339.1 WG repeat-containing protein [Brevibacillus agri]MDR9506474.1 WG repeat-containing protein [Brevibacillus agri]MED1644234.1 WG repeat-containing protein [Brevibacillus agri]MED1655502.1 WG repeat-containing protein [Brevibacillus agri]MED1687358.1 WG repeat-containing protein [Brevibacillus agri]